MADSLSSDTYFSLITAVWDLWKTLSVHILLVLYNVVHLRIVKVVYCLRIHRESVRISACPIHVHVINYNQPDLIKKSTASVNLKREQLNSISTMCRRSLLGQTVCDLLWSTRKSDIEKDRLINMRLVVTICFMLQRGDVTWMCSINAYIMLKLQLWYYYGTWHNSWLSGFTTGTNKPNR